MGTKKEIRHDLWVPHIGTLSKFKLCKKWGTYPPINIKPNDFNEAIKWIEDNITNRLTTLKTLDNDPQEQLVAILIGNDPTLPVNKVKREIRRLWPTRKKFKPVKKEIKKKEETSPEVTKEETLTEVISEVTKEEKVVVVEPVIKKAPKKRGPKNATGKKDSKRNKSDNGSKPVASRKNPRKQVPKRVP